MNMENREENSCGQSRSWTEKSRWAFEHPHDAKEREEESEQILRMKLKEMLAKEGFVSVQNDFARKRRRFAAICQREMLWNMGTAGN